MGDLNSYAMEDPIKIIEDAGYQNLEGPEYYGFVFDGQAGTLDYVMVNQALSAMVTGAESWHVNADEASAIDYNLVFGAGQRFSPNYFDGTVPYRCSDHDPVIVGVDLAEVC